MFLKVKDEDNLVRDDQSKAVLNTDNDALSTYKLQKLRSRELDRVISEHDEIKNELSEIKNLLLSLIGKTNDN